MAASQESFFKNKYIATGESSNGKTFHIPQFSGFGFGGQPEIKFNRIR